ncbi:hypothetical protein WJX74_004718 [Apatococcus lobatus]|uniref:Proton gradient regulation 5 n=1 Tax=Apatococcus lobatus TaxID=904363 RepID=A0AAW1QHY0_9CHLO
MSTACCSASYTSRCSPAFAQRQTRLTNTLRLRQPVQAACAAALPSSSSCISNSSLLVPHKSLAHGQRNARCITRMGKTAPDGIFTPIVVVARNVLGQKRFNSIRGQGISLHSQVIKTFCKEIGAEQKQIQGLIRLAKANGGKLGFLS